MKFQDIPADILAFRVKCIDGAADALKEQPVFSVAAMLTRPDAFEISLKDAVVFVRPVVAADLRGLNFELASGRAFLARLANPATDGSIELQIAFFSGQCLEMGELEIGVDEYVEAGIAKIERNNQFKGERLYRKLDEVSCFHQGDSAFFFLVAGSAFEGVLDDAESESESEKFLSEPTQNPKPELTRKNSFCITGDGLRFVVTETVLPEGKSVFMAARLTKVVNKSDRSLRLAKGRLRFVDWTRAGQVQVLAKAQMAALAKDDGSYLRKWDEFGDLEGELLLKNAREVGALSYSDMTPNRDGTVSVRIAQASDSALSLLKKGGVPEVEAVDELPEYLGNENLTFNEFSRWIEKEESVSKEKKKKERKLHLKILNFDADAKEIKLKVDGLPAASGTLIASLSGEIAQIKRRMAARRAILEGRAANPQLGLLIEENGEITSIRTPHKVAPLTAFVRGKIFKNPPTVMQERSIEVALNTPDIALIQGPPGTGKTTVIAAILERLNEMAGKHGTTARGQVLLTGFQHDAVENMIERLSLNGIPVPKFGKRSGMEEDDFNKFEKSLEEWCDKRAAELRKRNPQIAEIEREMEIKTLCLQYVQSPTRVLAVNLAEKIALLGIPILGEDGARRAANLAKKLSREERLNDSSNQWLPAVRRLRIRPETFADDGPDRATDALDDLSEVLEESERALLDKASLWHDEDGPPPFLMELAGLQKTLLLRVTTPPVFRVEKHHDEVVALAEAAIKRIKATGYSTKDTKSAALAEFLAELEGNPYGMIDAVSDYSFAFAATCQQSVNRQMQGKKGIDESGSQQRMEYEYVIVDEAARVSPRDLMVPMVQGKRIILVGDHRQLPHIIDDEVARQMEEGATGQQESDWLKKSMFQYLFSERLKALEKHDGIPRRATLDMQFRMHPLLGDFISRNFYERFDPLEKFGSGLPASHFHHDLPGTDGKPAAWLEVAEEKGNHQRSGTSWIRPAEATAIARQLQVWMKSDAGKNLSFGVISFYKAQAELIKKQLGTITDDDKKLRVGTVDSFQGMEFDVVFLSMVRTFPSKWRPKDDSREKQARTLFGHLCLYNRLNVSMSRQKKLLVVAGDSSLLMNDLAAEFIPGVVDFFNLCRTGEGTILQ